MSYQDAYLQDKRRKLSQELESDEMKDKLSYLTDEQKHDVEAVMADDEDMEDEGEKVLSVDDLERKNRALTVIEEFLQSENGQLRKSLREMQKENEELKNVLRKDFQVNYKSGVQYKA
ncbi:uncharacterized protein SPAPADRAFT_61600 [Spathaspora passalidarum NRRL Y-27907]|uniref:Uncharacterized protein n=1 Tax=Spathaspora passalidarum (strain NRRL Y-27907 / 11-Y1) TaxID=619300 RepID=G3ANK8_SPAPN|nr:uncharacterized protein SPAPADRAFT_61600 [Spathaspora passalidarum NRRL Y-27907]EGW32537.1 hypothetical protein SPAPADRAFT_61600 [Spathaspora passalidarum NRRL Y-27907]